MSRSDITARQLMAEVNRLDDSILTSEPMCRVYLKAMNNLLEKEMSDYVLQEDRQIFVTVFDTTNIHCKKAVRHVRGFSSLKKGEAFDFSKEAAHRADGEGAMYQATSNFHDGYVCADRTYDPEI